MFIRYLSLAKLTLIDQRLARLSWEVKRRKRTYLGYEQLLSLVRSFRTMQTRQQHPVHVAEFGVGRGGSATILAWLVEHLEGTLTLYDLFGRIPAPTDPDGKRAFERYRVILHEEEADYYGNLPDLLGTIKTQLASVCSLERIEFVPGRYEEILPTLDDARSFDLVHIDCDWYESVRAVLAYLRGRLGRGAILQIDDYSNWQGCRAAVDEAEWLAPYKRWFVGGPLVIDTSSKSDWQG